MKTQTLEGGRTFVLLGKVSQVAGKLVGVGAVTGFPGLNQGAVVSVELLNGARTGSQTVRLTQRQLHNGPASLGWQELSFGQDDFAKGILVSQG